MFGDDKPININPDERANMLSIGTHYGSKREQMQSAATPKERATLWKNIKGANPVYIAASLVFGTLSHLSRAYRWQYLLQPMGYHPKLSNRFMAVMAAYLANAILKPNGCHVVGQC